MYEVVVTTYRGLYRYSLGDVVKVVGFYNSSPRVQFITRAPKEASEIFTERELMCGIENFQVMLRDGHRREVVEFAGFLESGLGLKHVIIFVEVSKDCMLLQRENLEESIAYLRRCCSSIEGCLGSVYRVRRADRELGPLQISIVKPGTFNGLAELAMEGGAPANQYKPLLWGKIRISVSNPNSKPRIAHIRAESRRQLATAHETQLRHRTPLSSISGPGVPEPHLGTEGP